MWSDLFNNRSENGSIIKYEGVIEDHQQNKDSKMLVINMQRQGESVNGDKLFSTGKSLLKVTTHIDKTFGGMILNTYINCLLLATVNLYSGSTVFFNKNKNTGMGLYLISCVCFLLTTLSILRLICNTSAGQRLASAMSTSAETLSSIQMIRCKDEKSTQLKILKNDLKDKSASPINPFSAFSLSNSTLIGTFATILTYLIVLVQFKAAEDKEKTKILHDIQEAIQKISVNSSKSS